MNLVQASQVKERPMLCPSCGKQMRHYGASAGFICCDSKSYAERADGSMHRDVTSKTIASRAETDAFTVRFEGSLSDPEDRPSTRSPNAGPAGLRG
jgi:hypothetical protein